MLGALGIKALPLVLPQPISTDHRGVTSIEGRDKSRLVQSLGAKVHGYRHANLGPSRKSAGHRLVASMLECSVESAECTQEKGPFTTGAARSDLPSQP